MKVALWLIGLLLKLWQMVKANKQDAQQQIGARLVDAPLPVVGSPWFVIRASDIRIGHALRRAA